ncbi:MAG: glycoside hydrolase family 10 protein [Anaerolineae bacterium]
MGSWALFALLACLTFLLVVALAESRRQRLGEVETPTRYPVVPAAALSDRQDWLHNGQFQLAGETDQPIGWSLFDVTAAGASFNRRAGESFLRLDCGGGTCIAGLWQRLDELAAGDYYLEADVYLEGDREGAGTVAARLGFDPRGGVDPTAPGLLWSAPARGQGWQRIGLEFEETGGSGTVFIVFDALSAGADCRLAGARLLGPPGLTPPTSSAVTAAPEPTITDVEIRALYVSLSEMDLKDDSALRTALERAADARFNTIYLQVRRLGLAYYDSMIEPVAPPLRGEDGMRWDPLARACELAKEYGLQVHAWVEVLPVWQANLPAEELPSGHLYSLFSSRYGDDWLQPLGEDGVWTASPAHPQVRAYLASLFADLAARYPVDGLHLTGLEFPAASEPERGEALTALLEEIGREVRAARPGLGLSAEIAPVSRAQAADLGQDVAAWTPMGLVDLLVPAVYRLEAPAGPEGVAALVQEWGTADGKAHVVPALGAKSPSFPRLEEAITAARRAGAVGVAVHDAEDLTASGYWLRLATGPFRRPAEIPPLW